MTAQSSTHGTSHDTGNVRAVMQPRAGRPARFEKARNQRNAALRLVNYLSPFRGGMIFVLISVVIYTLLGLAGPYLMGRAIDQFIVTKQAAGLARIAVLMLAVYLLTNLFTALGNWVMAGISQRALKQVRKDLFGRLQTLPLAFFDRNPAGELMSRLTNDIDAINQAVSQNVTSLVASVLTMVGIVVAMFVLDHWLALTSLLVVPIMLWFTQFVASYTRKGFQVLQRDLGGLNGVMEESLSGQKVVRAFRRNDTVVEAFRQRNQ